MAAPAAQHGNSGVSPSSSPRLPSPPPFTEVQFGPKSPSISGAVSEFSLDASKIDDGASRRVRPGTKAADMAKGPPFVPLHQVDSAFQLQEYLKSLYTKLTRDENSNMVKPVDKEMALELSTPPTAQDTGDLIERNLWLYELCRLLCLKTSRVIVALFHDTPPCSAQICPEMRASEWQYLCAVHDPPKSCSAIDYCCHTLDWASNILSSNKHFPSRLSLGGEGGNAYQSMKQLTNIFRRVYRIYAHAWFQHREVFWAIEAEYGLYVFFKTVCDQYQLIPEDNYTIPPEAEGGREEAEEIPQQSTDKPNSVSILKKGDQKDPSAGEHVNSTVTTGATTRRHKHTPSTGVPVHVIAEGHEEDEDEETTMIELDGPGPADDSGPGPSLAPPEQRIERAKSPGMIIIPVNIDPERAPEDPTPVALHDTNPFGSPGPAALDDSSPSDTEASPITDPNQNDEVNYSTITEKEEVVTPDTVSSIAEEPEKTSTAVSELKSMDASTSLDSDNETTVATEDANHEQFEDAANETMDKIELGETVKKPAQEAKRDDNSDDLQIEPGVNSA